MTEFKNLINQLRQELSFIQDFLDSNSKDIYFSPKDINMNILIDSINNCFLLCENNLNNDELVNSLSQIFQKIKKKKNQVK